LIGALGGQADPFGGKLPPPPDGAGGCCAAGGGVGAGAWRCTGTAVGCAWGAVVAGGGGSSAGASVGGGSVAVALGGAVVALGRAVAVAFGVSVARGVLVGPVVEDGAGVAVSGTGIGVEEGATRTVGTAVVRADSTVVCLGVMAPKPAQTMHRRSTLPQPTTILPLRPLCQRAAMRAKMERMTAIVFRFLRRTCLLWRKAVRLFEVASLAQHRP